jgi:hypothetical protein
MVEPEMAIDFAWRMFLVGEPVPTSPEHALVAPHI